MVLVNILATFGAFFLFVSVVWVIKEIIKESKK